ncbi:ABC transporter ATP-binding protein [Gordonia sp. TBRC 11910]|uniref:ABC-type quaternary amine transporter n=1 Tax=Gordonia asplenii TaxID=2725283 RepID=A0A848L377_9ACTN|nr:ABC transporter ATP-binding protein [Gordonia asplenii]NMO05216.1 ABC transporter ATP-binding protein [Gordonia asplenii]
MIEVSRGGKTFGSTPVLIDVDLHVEPGAIAVVLGRSGSGKTTLLRAIAGFERLDTGRIVLAGTVVDDDERHLDARHRRVGYVPQDGALFPHLPVEANIAFGLRPGRQRRARVAQLLELTGLDDLGRRYPHELSGGQRQRVALARALAPEPAVILLDEPFSSLDAELRAELRADVAQLLRDAGTTAVVVTHDRDEAMAIADTVTVLANGRMVAAGTPRELYENPPDPIAARFLGVANLLPAHRLNGSMRSVLGPCGDGARTPIRGVHLLRPEQLSICTDRQPDAVPGTVESVVFGGATSTVTVGLDTAPEQTVTVVAPETGVAHLLPGSRIWVRATAPGVLLPSR